MDIIRPGTHKWEYHLPEGLFPKGIRKTYDPMEVPGPHEFVCVYCGQKAYLDKRFDGHYPIEPSTSGCSGELKDVYDIMMS